MLEKKNGNGWKAIRSRYKLEFDQRMKLPWARKMLFGFTREGPPSLPDRNLQSEDRIQLEWLEIEVVHPGRS